MKVLKPLSFAGGLVALCLSAQGCVETRTQGEYLCIKYWAGDTCAIKEDVSLGCDGHHRKIACISDSGSTIENGSMHNFWQDKYDTLTEAISALEACEKAFAENE